MYFGLHPPCWELHAGLESISFPHRLSYYSSLIIFYTSTSLNSWGGYFFVCENSRFKSFGHPMLLHSILGTTFLCNVLGTQNDTFPACFVWAKSKARVNLWHSSYGPHLIFQKFALRDKDLSNGFSDSEKQYYALDQALYKKWVFQILRKRSFINHVDSLGV